MNRADRPSGTDPHPFSRSLFVDDVPADGLDRSIEADAAECAAVAEEIGLPALHRLQAHFEIRWQSGRRLCVEGRVDATITQVCVVSLEPFDSDITQSIDVAFAPAPAPDRGLPEPTVVASRRRKHAGDRTEAPNAPTPVHVVEGEADPPDPIVDGRIDLGAVAVEFLTLALDFYPRKPGAHFSDVVLGEKGEEKPSAFAALARLKDRS